MNYICKNKSPEELLSLCGFEKTVDRGWHIVISKNKRKFDEYNKETWIPKMRLHALFYENNLNIHLDIPCGRRKHRALQRDEKVIEIIEKIKEHDTITACN